MYNEFFVTFLVTTEKDIDAHTAAEKIAMFLSDNSEYDAIGIYGGTAVKEHTSQKQWMVEINRALGEHSDKLKTMLFSSAAKTKPRPDEYIERGALLAEIHRKPAEAHNERCAQILEAILYAPTVDFVEVLHGQWVNDGDDWFCNRCNRNALCDNKTGEVVLSDICPHCGAVMDENK